VTEVLADELRRPEHAGPSGRRPVPDSWLLDRVSRTGVELFIALDQLDRAEEWAHRCHDSFWRPVSAARIHLARADAEQAVESLTQARPRCTRHAVVLRLTRARALSGTDHRQALTVAEEALARSAEEGLLQTAASEGPHIQNLLELSAWRVPDAWMERLRRIMVPAWAGRAAGPIEPLTEREREVLRLLPSRLTLGEIAAELFVSRNTLKFHMRAIYRKLGVDSRAAAVESARALLLLPRS
jgi:LuxR family maltose regulon positive regulatory protein